MIQVGKLVVDDGYPLHASIIGEPHFVKGSHQRNFIKESQKFFHGFRLVCIFGIQGLEEICIELHQGHFRTTLDKDVPEFTMKHLIAILDNFFGRIKQLGQPKISKLDRRIIESRGPFFHGIVDTPKQCNVASRNVKVVRIHRVHLGQFRC